MASSQHYVWASGHFLLLTAALYYIFSTVTMRSIAYTWWYKTAFTGGLVSYGIVCYKSLGIPQINGAYFRKATSDENVQYLLLALFWWTSKPIALTLVPYAIFSLFHALTFLRTTILPLVFPPTPPPAGSSAAPQQSSYAKTIQSWVRANYDKAMRVVAYTELIIMLRVTVGAMIFKNSFTTPIVYAHFLRQRYYFSQFSRDAIFQAGAAIDGQIHRAPPILGNVWGHVKNLLGRWAGSVIVPQGNQGPATPQANRRPPRA